LILPIDQPPRLSALVRCVRLAKAGVSDYMNDMTNVVFMLNRICELVLHDRKR